MPRMASRALTPLLITLAVLAGCGAGETQGSRSQEKPAPAETTAGQEKTAAGERGEIIFKDDFENPLSGWAVEDTDYGAFRYQGGAFHGPMYTGGAYSVLARQGVALSDTRFEGERYREDLAG